jgi:hypothetical protein
MDHNRQSDLRRTVAPLRRKIGLERGSEGARERESGGAGVKKRLFASPSLTLSLSRTLAPSLSRSLALPLALSLCLAGCSRPVTEAEKRAAVDEFFTQARSCWPNDGESSAPLAIESVVSDKNATRVRLIAYARDEAVDFYLPVYRMSAGRWLINEKGRVYLFDEQCLESKLNDAKPSPGSLSDFLGGEKIPPDGRIRLKPGQAFEATLVFPPLPDRARVGALVYDRRVLPFALD